MSLLEAQRQLLEENDAIEVAVANRFRKFPALAEKCNIDRDHELVPKKKRSHKETVLLENELKFFDETYKNNRMRMKEQLSSKTELVSEINVFKDPKMKFYLILDAMKELSEKRQDKLGSLRNTLSMVLPYLSATEEDRKADSNKVKRRCLLSSMGTHIGEHLAEVFNEVELFGQFVDLSYFYEQYKLLVPANVSYTEYLRKFALFPYETFKADEYKRYLNRLLEYLLRFHQLTHPLTDVTKILHDIDENSSEYQVRNNTEDARNDGVPDEEGKVFCRACHKIFAKESVYKAHLDGKKHKKNQKVAEDNSAPSTTNSNYKLEQQISKLSSLLKPTIDATINHIERRAVASEREKLIEDTALAQEDSEYTATDTDAGDSSHSEEDDDDDLLTKHLPLGTDGAPIPLWLYKLQGLHRSYVCEICGNIKYKGRQQFDKHFSLAKHVFGLRCLGVDDDDIINFAGISSIHEANELWSKLKKAKKNLENTIENAVEVEDDEGNVMPEKDYIELKRQGLL